jgi:copper chaperone CopZ
MEGIASVKTSASEHTVTVQFDSEKTSLDDIIKSLNDVGYTVGEPVAVEPEG